MMLAAKAGGRVGARASVQAGGGRPFCLRVSAGGPAVSVRPRAPVDIVQMGWAQLLLQLKFTSIIPKGDRCALYI